MPPPAIESRIREGFPGQRMLVLPRPIVQAAAEGGLPIGLVPSDVGYFPTAKHHYVERWSGLPQLIVILCVRGNGWLRLGGQIHHVSAGQVAWIPPGQPHVYGAAEDQPWSIYWCHAAGQMADGFANLLSARGTGPVLDVGRRPQLSGLFEEVAAELKQGYGFHHLLPASAALAHLLGLIFAGGTGQGMEAADATARVREAAAYLRGHCEGKVQVAEIARMSDLSVSHFCALFKRELGFAPLDFFIRAKMQRACELLDTTALPLKEIAEQLGFADPLYFSRAFRKIQGVAPSQYRAIVKG